MYIGFFSVVAIAVIIILWQHMRENPAWFPSVEPGTGRRVARVAFQLWIVAVALWFVITAIVFEVPTRGIDLKFWPAYLVSFFAPPLIVLTIGACIAWACRGLGRMARGV